DYGFAEYLLASVGTNEQQLSIGIDKQFSTVRRNSRRQRRQYKDAKNGYSCRRHNGRYNSGSERVLRYPKESRLPAQAAPRVERQFVGADFRRRERIGTRCYPLLRGGGAAPCKQNVSLPCIGRSGGGQTFLQQALTSPAAPNLM